MNQDERIFGHIPEKDSFESNSRAHDSPLLPLFNNDSHLAGDDEEEYDFVFVFEVALIVKNNIKMSIHCSVIKQIHFGYKCPSKSLSDSKTLLASLKLSNEIVKNTV